MTIESLRTETVLLDRANIQTLTGKSLGRDLIYSLLERLPHITAGQRGTGTVRLVRAETLNVFFARLEREELDLVTVVRVWTSERFQTWWQDGDKR
jgi:hypothetical protein